MNLFRITEKADLKYFEDYIGASNAVKLPGLAQYQFLSWSEMGEAELKGGPR